MKSVKRAMAAEFSLEKARTVRASQVGIVRRIFTAYAGDASVATIAADLVADGIPSSKRSCWTPGMVSYVLQNDAYSGALVYWFRNGERPSALLNLRDSDSDRVVRCENAHPAIIERGLWDSVQARIRAPSTRRTDAMLLDDLRAARARWRPGKRPPREVVTAADLRSGYGKPDGEVITPRKVEEAVGRLLASIGSAMHVTPFEGGYLLDHLLQVGVRVSLPHARFGGTPPREIAPRV